MLMSMISAPRSTLCRAAAASASGSAPAICTPIGATSPEWSMRRTLFFVRQSRGSDVVISDTA
jgi:hypothetical protein